MRATNYFLNELQNSVNKGVDGSQSHHAGHQQFLPHLWQEGVHLNSQGSFERKENTHPFGVPLSCR